MELSQRQKKLIYEFIAILPGEIITSQALAEIVNVTNRTIKKDVTDLNAVLVEYGARINSVVGKGYSLEVNDQFLFSQFISVLHSQDSSGVNEIPKYRYERVNYIIKKLLAIDYFILLEDLAQELYVSRSTVVGDLREVKKILREYQLDIRTKPAYGIILEGSEINKRLCISEYFFHSDVYTGFFAADHAMFVSNSNQNEISFVHRLLIDILNEYDIRISDFSLQNLVIHIIIALRRWQFYNYVRLPEERLKKIRKYNEYDAGKRIKEEIEKWQNIVLPEEEEAYFALHLHSKHVNNLDDLDRRDIEKVELTLFETYRKLQKDYNFIAFNKNAFEQYVRLHIPVMVERLRTGMVLRYPYVYKTLAKYPLATHLNMIFARIIEDEFDVNINIGEFGYLLLYMNLLIQESSRSKIKILLASGQGRPEMITLLNELNETLGNDIQSIDVCDFYKIDTIKLHDYALLLTTIPIPKEMNMPIPTVYISDSIPYKSQVTKALNEVFVDKSCVEKVIQPKYFINRLKVSDREEVIRRISRAFDNRQNEVYEMLWEGENEFSGETEDNIVYLHTKERVDEDFIFFAILKKPIIWKKRWIQMVIWVNCTSDIIKLRTYYDIVKQIIDMNDNNIQALLEYKNYDVFYENVVSLMQKGG